MSRIGKIPIDIPAKTIVLFDEESLCLEVKGPKGELQQIIGKGFKVRKEDEKIFIERPSDQKRHKALHGLYRSLVANMVEGVNQGYRRELELIGVGFKAVAQDNVLELSIGYSHSIVIAIPKEVKVETVTKKGFNPTIILEGIDKQLVGHVGAKIKSLRKKDPYKGKGIYYKGEHIRRKVGKTASK